MITDFTTRELNEELRRRELQAFSIDKIKNELNKREEEIYTQNRIDIKRYKGLTQNLLLNDVDINKINRINTKQTDIDGQLVIVIEVHTHDGRVLLFDKRNCEILKEYQI